MKEILALMWSKMKVFSEHYVKLCILPQRTAVPIVMEKYFFAGYLEPNGNASLRSTEVEKLTPLL